MGRSVPGQGQHPGEGEWCEDSALVDVLEPYGTRQRKAAAGPYRGHLRYGRPRLGGASMKRSFLPSRACVAVHQVRSADTAEDAETFPVSAERGGRRERSGRPRQRGGAVRMIVVLLGAAM